MTSHTDHDRPAPASTFRLLLLGFLVVVALLGAGTSIWLLGSRGSDALGVRGAASETQRERDAVMSQTRQFMLRMGTYSPDQLEDGKLPQYRELVTAVITPKFRASFEQSVATAEQLVAQAGVSRQAEVFSTGVVTLDDDSATALVAGTFTDSYTTKQGQEQEQQPLPFRIEVDLVRSDGEWLVDDFTPVTGSQE